MGRLRHRLVALSLFSISCASAGIGTSAFADVFDVETGDRPRFGLPAETVATRFEAKESRYLHVKMDTSILVRASIQLVPEKVTYHVAPVGSATSTRVHLSGFLPNTTYHKYEDTYERHEEFLTDSDGGYAYDQDVREAHLVFIQPRKSTKFIRDDANGGDCSSVGTWDSSAKTCTFITDILETTEIVSDGITIDGAGHSLRGVGTGSGIFLSGVSNVTIKNLNISNFTDGVFLNQTNGVTIDKISFSGNASSCVFGLDASGTALTASSCTGTQDSVGIFIGTVTLGGLPSTSILNNQFSNLAQGIALDGMNGGVLTSNTITNTKFSGIDVSKSKNLTLRSNIISRGLYVRSVVPQGNTLVVDDQYLANDIDQSNTVGGKPIWYMKDQVGETVDGATVNVGQLVCIRCTNVTLKNLLIDGPEYAILLEKTNNVSLSHSTTSNAFTGVRLHNSSGNTISGNAFVSNAFGFFSAYGGSGNTLEKNTFSNGTSYSLVLADAGARIRHNAFTNNAALMDFVNAVDPIFSQNNILSNGSSGPIATGRGNINLDNGPVEGGNYWASFDSVAEGCANLLGGDSFCDQPYLVGAVGYDRYPWIARDQWPSETPAPPPVSQKPTLSGLGQFRMLGVDPILEGATFVGNTAVFKATLNDADSSSAQLEVELKQVGQSFNGQDTLLSSSVATGSVATIAKDDLIVKDHLYTAGGNQAAFIWRARAVDAEGNTSDWQEFGLPSARDFSIKVVPLWTQRISDYPSQELTRDWEGATYSHADVKGFRCGSNIGACGCAISSLVMLGHYYGVENSIDGREITPRTINAWLNANGGYTKDIRPETLANPTLYEENNGGVIWDLGTAFLGGSLIGGKPASLFSIVHGVLPGDSQIALSLSELRPFIAYNKLAGHYLVIDSLLKESPAATTYTVRDPFYYGTKTLDEPTAVPQLVRQYKNKFNTAHLFTKGNTPHLASGAYYSIASPAELVITDPSGKRIGYNPKTKVSYAEIPGATYYQEGDVVSSEMDIANIHATKIVHLPALAIGTYTAQVIGTGNGPYTYSAVVFDQQGAIHKEIFSGTTSLNTESVYLTTFSASSTTIDTTPGPKDLLNSLKSKITASTSKPLVKAAAIVLVDAAIEALNNGKVKIAKAALDLLTALVRLEKGKGIPSTVANELLAIIQELNKVLK